MEDKNKKLEDRGDIKEEEKEGGIMTSLISDLVEGRKIENLEGEKESDEASEVGSSGIINTIISKLVNSNHEAEDVGIKNDEKGENGVNNEENKSDSGGIFNSIMSKFVNPEVEENVTSVIESDEKVKNGVKNEENSSGGGGNIIDNIVSHLPSSLTDDVDPPTDEASILIHSIIHD